MKVDESALNQAQLKDWALYKKNFPKDGVNDTLDCSSYSYFEHLKYPISQSTVEGGKEKLVDLFTNTNKPFLSLTKGDKFSRKSFLEFMVNNGERKKLNVNHYINLLKDSRNYINMWSVPMLDVVVTFNQVTGKCFTSLYDKRMAFPSDIHRFPHRQSSIHRDTILSTGIGMLISNSRKCSNYDEFLFFSGIVLNEFFARGVEFTLLLGIVRKFVKNYKFKVELLKYKHKYTLIEHHLCKQIVFKPSLDF